MVAVVTSNPTGGIFICLFFKTLSVIIVQKCQICVVNEKMKNPIPSTLILPFPIRCIRKEAIGGILDIFR